MAVRRVELVRVGEQTRMGTCYQQVPVRLMPPFVLDSEPASLLYLINLTAGLMDGDGHLIEVRARAGTRAVVAGQSATRVHPAVASYATQQWAVDVEDDACLVVLPGPTIPFRGSRYFQRAGVSLAARARLIWGDIWLAGRYERGELSERFQFEQIVQDFEAAEASGSSSATASGGTVPGTPRIPSGTWEGTWRAAACSSRAHSSDDTSRGPSGTPKIAVRTRHRR